MSVHISRCCAVVILGLTGTMLLPHSLWAQDARHTRFGDTTTALAGDDHAESAKGELAALEGMWVRRQTDAKGNVLRVEKQIDGSRETVTVYRTNQGKRTVVSQWQADISVKKTAHVRILTFKNVTYTAGKLKGSRITAGRSYLYQVRNNALVATYGMLNSDRGTRLRIEVYKRMRKTVSPDDVQ